MRKRQFLTAVMALLASWFARGDEFTDLDASMEMPQPPEVLNEIEPLGDITKANSLFTTAYVDYRVRQMLKELPKQIGTPAAGGAPRVRNAHTESLEICPVSAPPGATTVINVCPINGLIVQ